jgi:hypothetical protein
MFKLRLYKFLSIFIPYFKRKFMNKDTMVRYVNNTVSDHLKKYNNNKNFTIKPNIITWSNTVGQEIKIGYNVTYQSIDFVISIKYFEDSVEIKFSGSLNNCDEELREITSFYSYFRSINKDELKKIFKHFELY